MREMGLKTRHLQEALQWIGWSLKLIKKESKPKELYNTYRIVDHLKKDTLYKVTDWNSKNYITTIECEACTAEGHISCVAAFTLDDCVISTEYKHESVYIQPSPLTHLAFYHFKY